MMYLFMFGKILFGGFFVMSGFNHFKNLEMYTGYAKSKDIPMAKLGVAVSGVLLLLGGLGVIFGIREVLALYMLAIFLIIITPTMHAFWKVTDPMARSGDRVNFFKNVALLGAVLMLLALHTGAISSWMLF